MKIRFDAPPLAAQQSNGLGVRYAAAKREVPRWRWYLMVVLISIPMLYFAAPLIIAFLWHTAPAVVLLQSVTVKAPAEGEVVSLAKDGAVVESGTVLAVIQPRRLVSSASVGSLLADGLPPTAAGPASRPPGAPGVSDARVDGSATPADMQADLLAQAVALASKEVGARRERVVAIEDLMRAHAATRAELEAARSLLSQAEANLLHARLDAAAHARLVSDARAMSTVAPAAGRASGEPVSAVATSPFRGKVTRVFAVPGETVTSASELLVVQGDKPPVIEAYVSPSDADLARKGRLATLSFLDGGRLPARIEEVEPQAARWPADRVGPLSPRSQAIVVRMRPLDPLPAKYLINQLPLNVRFAWRMPWQGM